tara:strand:- start:4239 stop:5327 length:1089 start_codon:yes stop_codon:yes gene_type:complete
MSYDEFFELPQPVHYKGKTIYKVRRYGDVLENRGSLFQEIVNRVEIDELLKPDFTLPINEEENEDLENEYTLHCYRVNCFLSHNQHPFQNLTDIDRAMHIDFLRSKRQDNFENYEDEETYAKCFLFVELALIADRFKNYEWAHELVSRVFNFLPEEITGDENNTGTIPDYNESSVATGQQHFDLTDLPLIARKLLRKTEDSRNLFPNYNLTPYAPGEEPGFLLKYKTAIKTEDYESADYYNDQIKPVQQKFNRFTKANMEVIIENSFINFVAKNMLLTYTRGEYEPRINEEEDQTGFQLVDDQGGLIFEVMDTPKKGHIFSVTPDVLRGAFTMINSFEYIFRFGREPFLGQSQDNFQIYDGM